MFRFDRRITIALVVWLTAWALLGLAAARAEAGWRIDRAEAVAATVWGDPCPGGVTVRWSAAPADDGVPAGYTAAAWTYPRRQPCTVYYNADLPTTWEEFCSRMIHELGHLDGQDHSPNPNSIMYFAPPDDPRCDERGRPYLEAHGVL